MACSNHFAPWRPGQSPRAANSRSRSPRQYLPHFAQHGEFAFLNREMVGLDSIIHHNTIINEGAFYHPVVIVGSTENGAIATCVQVTSFGNGDIMTKYPRPNLATRRRLYLPINHNDQTQPHDDTSLLRLQNDRNMEKQSYIHLDGFFQIETRYLSAWKGRRNVLAAESLLVVQLWLRMFMSGKMEVPRSPGIASCLEHGKVLPVHYGLSAVPLLSLPPVTFHYPIVQPSFVLPMLDKNITAAPWIIDDNLAMLAHTHFDHRRSISVAA